MPQRSARLPPAWYAVEERKRGCCRRLPARFCCAWVCFALLLSFVSYMSHPSPLSSSRLLGLQAFDSIRNPTPASGQAVDSTVQNNADTSAFVSTAPSYPLDVYAPQVPNPVPLTEITVHSCFPLLLRNCKPLTTPEKDARLGPWVLVDRPLDADTATARSKKTGEFGIPSLDFLGQLMASFETKYIFYRRSRRSDVPKIVDLRLVQTGADNRPVGGDYAGWHRVSEDMRSTFLAAASKKMPVHLYYRTVGGTAQDKDGQEGMAPEILSATDQALNSDPITEVDVIYGTGPAWPGFKQVGLAVQSNEQLNVAQVTLTARRTPERLPNEPPDPLFKEDGTFKIMQLSDLHLSVRHELCRDVAWNTPSKPCIADDDTIKMIEKWLDEEKPDMIVFTGDQLNGQGTSWDEKSVIPKWARLAIDRKIPWASIQGNHDSQSGVLTRGEQQALLSRLPYSHTRVGPTRLHDGNGAGNFYVKLRSPKPDKIHLFTLYLLDSGEYAPVDHWHPFKFSGYDWVRPDQIEWFKDISKKVSGIERPYEGDGAKDLGKIWQRDGDLVERDQQRYLSKPKAFMFVHIPVPEAFDAADRQIGSEVTQFGEMKEIKTVEGAQKKAGLFSAILDRPKEEQDVIGFFHGHMHMNAGCRRVKGVWICFNGGSSFAAYGEKGFDRRTRIINISNWGQKVDTWQVMESTPGRFEQHTLFEETGPVI